MGNNLLSGIQNIDYIKSVENLIKSNCIVDFGIIQEVVAKGIVNVSVAVSGTEEDIICLTCVLANTASSGFTLDITPSPGDRVIVLYPRRYDEGMFAVPSDDSDKIKTIVNPDVNGYNLSSGIALLFNQYQQSSHKNLLKIENGGFTYTSSDSDGNTLNTVSLNTSGKLSVTTKSDKDTTILSMTADNSGFSITDKAGNEIVSSTTSGSEAVTINGHLKIKK